MRSIRLQGRARYEQTARESAKSKGSNMRKFFAAIFAALVAVAGVALASPAHADTTTVTVRESDVDLSQTRATGHNDFLREGVHVWTESNTSTDKAAGYYPVGVPIDDVDSVSQHWVGSEPQPGLQLVVDLGYADDTGAPDGVPDGLLIYEPVYGGELWLSNGSSQAMKDFATDAGMTGGGHGSNWHGTLEQWQDVVPNNTEVLSAGWSLGSGIKGDGVLFSQTVGDSVYEFTSDAVPNERPVADFEFVMGNAPKSAVFDGSVSTDSDGTVDSYEWDFGDGTTATGVVVSHTFADAGRHRVTLTVTDNGGATDTSVQRVYAKSGVAKPVADAEVLNPRPGVARVNVTATQPEGTTPTPRGAYYRVLKTVKGAASDGVIEKSEVKRSLAQGRVFADNSDHMRFRIKRDGPVTVVSYGDVLTHQYVNGKAARKGWDRHGWDRVNLF